MFCCIFKSLFLPSYHTLPVCSKTETYVCTCAGCNVGCSHPLLCRPAEISVFAHHTPRRGQQTHSGQRQSLHRTVPFSYRQSRDSLFTVPGAGAIAQWVGCLPRMQATRVWFPVSPMVPWAPPGVILSAEPGVTAVHHQVWPKKDKKKKQPPHWSPFLLKGYKDWALKR